MSDFVTRMISPMTSPMTSPLSGATVNSHTMTLTVAALNVANELFGAAYHDAELAPVGTITDRSGFDRTNGGNTFFDKFQGSVNTNNLVIRFTDGDVDVPIKLDNVDSVTVTLLPVDRSATLTWREGIGDYYAPSVDPSFGIWLESNVGNSGDFKIDWSL